MKLQLLKATVDHTVNIFIQDSSSTTGAGLTGLVFNSASLTCYYVRPKLAAAALTLATQTTTGAHSDGGFVEVDATNMPGTYRLDLSDAILATGVDHVLVMLQGATNMAPCVLEIQLTDMDLNDGVRGGMTALPNFAADAGGGLPISIAGSLDLDALNTAAVRLTAARAQVLDDWVNAGRLDAILDIIAGDVVNIDGAVMRGTDSAALASVATEARLAELDAANLPAVTDGIKTVTDGLNNLSAADVNAEVVNVLKTDAIAEQAAGIPPTTPTFEEAVMYLYMALRNNSKTTATVRSIANSSNAVIAKTGTTLMSDDGTTFQQGELDTGGP